MDSRRNDPYLEDGGPGAEVVVSPPDSGDKSHLHGDASGISAPPIPVPATVPSAASLEHEREKAGSVNEAAGVGPGASDVETVDGRPKDVYDRFTKAQKTRIVAIVSYSAFISRTRRYGQGCTKLTWPQPSRLQCSCRPFLKCQKTCIQLHPSSTTPSVSVSSTDLRAR